MFFPKKTFPSVKPSLSNHQPKTDLLTKQKEIKKHSFDKTVQERQRLKAVEYSSKDPIKTTVKQRGELLARRLEQMQNKYNK